jgi:CubicO group peptidase (beta-lactamase class C family)
MLKNCAITVLFCIYTFLVFSCKKDEKLEINGNSVILNSLVSKIEDNQYGGEVHSLIIIKNDSVIFEKYFNGYSREKKHALYSVTKSFTSALMGICLQKGYISSIEEPILDFFPQYQGTIANYDSLKEKITIADLLTMRAGFSWDEWSIPYSNSDNLIFKMTNSNNWVKFVLDQPMAYVPGTHFTYNSGVSNILSAIITKATGKSAKTFAEENLFNHLGIKDLSWDNSATNVSVGGWGLSLRPIDMVKFGQLYLHKGRWNDVQIIPENWVEESIQPHCQANKWCDYGYQWWRYGKAMERPDVLPVADVFFASGRGEQYIWVLPSYNAVAVCTAWNDGQQKLEPVLWEYVVKALDEL